MGLTKKLLDEQNQKDILYDMEYAEYIYYSYQRIQKDEKKKTPELRGKQHIRAKKKITGNNVEIRIRSHRQR